MQSHRSKKAGLPTILKYLSLSFFIISLPHANANSNIEEGVYIYDKNSEALQDGGKTQRAVDSIIRHTREPINTGSFAPALIIKNRKAFIYTLASNAIDERYEALSITSEATVVHKQGSEFSISYQTQNYYPNFISIGRPTSKKPLKLLNPVRVEMNANLTPEGDIKITECFTKEFDRSQWRKSIDYLGLCEPSTSTLFNVTKYVQGRKEWAHLF